MRLNEDPIGTVNPFVHKLVIPIRRSECDESAGDPGGVTAVTRRRVRERRNRER